MEKDNNENIALFDMDGTLCDYHGQMETDLEEIRAPDEPAFEFEFVGDDKIPAYIRKRMFLIRNQPGWWTKLAVYDDGWNVYGAIRDLGFKIHVLTKGPYKSVAAWSEKVQWVRTNMSPDVQITITEDKGLVYGKILVDDYPDYITRWLEWRPRGLVIMPAHPYNKDFSHPNVFRYDGSRANHVVMCALLRRVKERGSGEPLVM